MTTLETRKLDSILVATDFSDTAKAGVDWAVEIARTHDAHIDLVHALLVPNRATDFVPSPPDFTEELQQAASGKLNQVVESLRHDQVEAYPHLRLGIPSQVILEAAEEKKADLVVIGTRGLTGFRHLLLGSTAERVVQHSSVPVLTVHPADANKHRSIKTVLVPTDFSLDSDAAYEAALMLLGSDLSAAKVVLLHVYHLPYEYTAYGTIPTSIDYFKDVEGVAESRLEEKAEALRQAGLTVATIAREGYPPEVVVEEAEAAGADLIAMGTHGRTGLAHLVLGSTAERVVQRASCPVLTVRPEPTESK